jgi:peroxiredoxin
MGILLVVFAISIGYATFIENDFDSTTAKMLIYNAKWFEGLMLLMVINFTGMIFTRQLYRKSKINILVIHISLIVILVGAAITRYIGFEGQMHIRQGQTTDQYLSLDTYFNIHVKDAADEKNVSKRIWLSPAQKELYADDIDFKNLTFNVVMDRYMPNAIEGLKPDVNGTPIVSIMTSGPGGRADGILKYGEKANLSGLVITFGDTISRANIQFIINNGDLLMRKPHQHAADDVIADHPEPEFEKVNSMQILQAGNVNLMIRDYAERAILAYAPAQDEHQRGIKVAKVKVNNIDYYLKYGEWEQINMNGVMVSLKFGNQTWVLPFSLKLNEFQLERYPGSMSPSSFASEITLIDSKNNVEKPFRIFMNNILEYKGYRFYQSSYDQDEKGTILSVNHDYYGTIVSYIGYFLLFGSLIVSLFTKKTRFRRVSQQIKETHDKRKKLLLGMFAFILMFGGSFSAIAQDQNQLSKEHAAQFGRLLLQNKDGRIVPVNTISSEVLVKIFKKNSFEGLSSDQVFLGMISNPDHWQNRKMVKVGDKAPQFTLINHEMKPVSLSDYQEKNVVLAFYPGAFTGGCKKEMCTLRDEIAELEAIEAQVLGISVNDPFTNRAFHEDNVLNFPLLCDYNREVVKKYDVYHENFAGMKGCTAAKRSIFIVDGKGTISYKWVTDDPGIMPNINEIITELSK